MMRKILILLLIAHTLVSAWVFQTDSFFSVIPPFNERYPYQLFSDLTVSLGIVLLFIYRELVQKNKPKKLFCLCAVGTACLGSFAPLAYLLWDKELLSSDAQQ